MKKFITCVLSLMIIALYILPVTAVDAVNLSTKEIDSMLESLIKMKK